MKNILSVAVAVALGSASAAYGQTPRSERPYRGLFGGGLAGAEQLVAASASVGGGYDDNVLAGQRGGSAIGDPRRSRAGAFSAASGSVAYTLNREGLSASLSAAGTARYRPVVSSDVSAGYSGAAGVSFPLWRGARATADQSVGYQPYVVLDLLPPLSSVQFETASVAGPEFAFRDERSLRVATGMNLSQKVSRRGAVGLAYTRQTSYYDGARPDYSRQAASGRYTLGLGRGLGARLGYGYRRAASAGLQGQSAVVRNIDVGLDFNRALSFSRRTTLTFSTGSAAVSQAGRTRYRLTGGAQLQHEIGRTWSAALAYDRSVRFVDVFDTPHVADAANLGFSGMVNRRLAVHSQAGVSFGHLGTSGKGRAFDTYVAGTGLTFGLTRNLGVGLDYSFYRYAFGQGTSLPAGFNRETNRRSLYGYVSLWAPVVHRMRRADAAR